MQEKEIQDYRLQDRFKVFCFKYDLEALILAAKSALENVLGGSSVETNWQIPVEDQNHDLPPKMVVETIFRNQGKCYKGTVHASLILGQANYQELAEKCFQCFKPFVAFLEALSLPTIEIS